MLTIITLTYLNHWGISQVQLAVRSTHEHTVFSFIGEELTFVVFGHKGDMFWRFWVPLSRPAQWDSSGSYVGDFVSYHCIVDFAEVLKTTGWGKRPWAFKISQINPNDWLKFKQIFGVEIRKGSTLFSRQPKFVWGHTSKESWLPKFHKHPNDDG